MVYIRNRMGNFPVVALHEDFMRDPDMFKSDLDSNVVEGGVER